MTAVPERGSRCRSTSRSTAVGTLRQGTRGVDPVLQQQPRDTLPLDYFPGKSLFQGWQPRFLETYVTYGLVAGRDGGVTLLCPPEAEAHGFENYPVDVWRWPGRLRVPVLIVRGENSDVLTQASCERFLRLCPGAEGLLLPGAGHLFPMKKPGETVRLIRQLASAGGSSRGE